MNLFFDSLWRAMAYCLRPRVIALSVLPLLLMVALSFGLGYYYWDSTLKAVQAALESSSMLNSMWSWLQSIGIGGLKTLLAPLIVIFAITPIIMMASLLLVMLFMTPALTELVVARRFAQLERKHGGSVLLSLGWSLGSTVLALIALVVSIPLWLVPPLILVLPPLIWGWLTYRVMAFDALAEHASAEERREIFRRHWGWLLSMGVLCGYLGAAPGLIWASGGLFSAVFIVIVPIAIWIYMLIFALSSLWFVHYCLAALQALRSEKAAAMATTILDVKAVPLPHDSAFDPHTPT